MRIGYLLYDESYSGVIESQALDVVRFYNAQKEHHAVLITALPFRSHREVLDKYKASISAPILSMIALPQKLQVLGLRMEMLRMARLAKKANVDLLICRNALSCYIALNARKYMANNSKPIICYDGRGALKAEAAEFKVYPESFKTTLFRAERASVLHSDFRIAVTKELVEWWNMEYGYNSENHAIIPTTISTQVQEFDPKKNRTRWRQHFGFDATEVVLAFAGGKADWQGLTFWLPHMHEWLENIPHLKLLLLTPPHPLISELFARFPSRVINTFVPHEDVLNALSAADHGIMWRELNVTNKVASPTKLSEYLQAGLNIITNKGTAVSRIVMEHKIGICLQPKYRPDYSLILASSRHPLEKLNLTKNSFYNGIIGKVPFDEGNR